MPKALDNEISEEQGGIIMVSDEHWICEQHGDQGDKWMVVNQSRFCIDCLEQLLLEKMPTLKDRED